MNFPDYYGGNLNAFDDCLGDLYNDRYKGVVIVLREYDEFLSSDRNLAEAILDIIAAESRYWLVTGKKLIGLIQSNEPNLELSKLDGVSPSWNSAEWMNETRNN